MAMKFAVGYQLPEESEEPFANIARDFSAHVEEVYFPWLDMPSGRSPMTKRSGFVDWDAQRRLQDDLRAIKGMGVKLDLLLNANCYGARSLSKSLANLVCSVIQHLREAVGLDVVTTASLMIARTVRENFDDVEVRASVNMRIGTVKGMECVADLFGSFYVQREYNRDLQRIAELKDWADAHGKGLYLLVNSGCLNFCSAQTFHDNLVAHEAEIAGAVNISGWVPSVCWNYYANKGHWVSVLQNSWIRPEDLGNYEAHFPVVKLATRMHANPRKVLRAYSDGGYRGNLLDLLEPGHGPLFAPHIIDNTRFPQDWFERTTRCDKQCHRCDYCASVLREVLVNISPERGDS